MPRPPRADAAGEIYHALSLERVNRPVSEKEEEQLRWQTGAIRRSGTLDDLSQRRESTIWSQRSESVVGHANSTQTSN